MTAGDGANGVAGDEGEPLVTCEFKRAKITVFADRVVVERAGGSLFDDVTVPMAEIEGVDYSSGVLTGHLQVRRAGADLDDGRRLSHPVDAYTLHFSRSDRPCAERAHDAILEHCGGE